MPKPLKEDSLLVAPPVLTDALLHRIYELNLDYLQLLRSEQAEAHCAAQLQHFPPQVLELIASSGAQALQRLARAPYTLYSLGFEDLKFWRAACDSDDELAARYCTNTSAWVQGPFYEVALLFAWHIATSNRLAARVVLAMPDELIGLFVDTPLARIRRIAIDYPGLLMPRWPANRGFWPDLLRFAQGDDRARLTTVTLLGTQLIAAQLQASAGQDQRVLNAHRLQYSARVRGGKVRMKLGVGS